MTDTTQLLTLMAQKVDCLTQLCDYGARQGMCIAAGETNELLKVLAVKQRLIENLQRIERGLDPFRGQDPAQRPWRTPQDRESCVALLVQAETLIREIRRQDEHSEIELRHRRDAIAQELNSLHVVGQAQAAYATEVENQRAGRLNFCSEG